MKPIGSILIGIAIVLLALLGLLLTAMCFAIVGGKWTLLWADFESVAERTQRASIPSRDHGLAQCEDNAPGYRDETRPGQPIRSNAGIAGSTPAALILSTGQAARRLKQIVNAPSRHGRSIRKEPVLWHRKCSSVAEHRTSTPMMWVRFPSLAPKLCAHRRNGIITSDLCTALRMQVGQG